MDGPKRVKERGGPPPGAHDSGSPAGLEDVARDYLNIAQVVLLALDARGTVSLINRKGCQILGYPEAEVLGRNWFQGFLPAAVSEGVHSTFLKIMAGEVESAEYFENPVLAKDGTTPLIAWHNALLRDRAGRIIGTLSSGLDITEKRAQEQQLRLMARIAEQVGEGVALADTDGKLLWANRAWAAMHGYEPEELVGKPLSTSHSPEQMEKDVLPFNELVLKNGRHTGEVGHIRRDGTEFLTEMTSTLLTAEEGYVAGLIGFAKDISDRRRAEAELAESEHRFRTLAENSSTAILIYQGERFVYVNPAAEKISGYTRDEILRMCFWDLVHPGYRDLIRERGFARQRGEAISSRYEYPIVSKAGEVRWIDFNAGLTEYEGQPAVIASLFDITERRRMEEELRHRTEHLEAVFRAMPDLYFRMDLEGVILESFAGNPDDLYVPPDSFLGKKIQDVLPPPLGKRFLQAIRAVLRTGHSRRLEYTLDVPSGAQPFECRLVPLSEDQVIGVVRSLAEIRRAEQALEASEAHYRFLVESIDEIFYAIRIEGEPAEERVTFVGEPAKRILGYDPGEFQRDHGLWFRLVHPEDFKRLDPAIRESLSRGAGILVTYRVRHNLTGEYRWVEDHIVPNTDGEGNLIGYQGILRDITERRQAEERAADALNRFQSVIENAPSVAIQGFGRDGTILQWNRASSLVYGYDATDVLGKRIQDVILGEQEGREFEESLDWIWRHGKPSETREWPVRNRDGSERWVLSTMFPVFERGLITHCYCLDVDITARKAAEEALQRRNRQLMALVSSSQAMAGSPNLEAWAQAICQACIDAFSCRMAWIGLVTPESTEILPIASAGFDEGYVKNSRVRWDESSRAQGPVGRCIKTRRTIFMDTRDPSFAPWRKEAERRGFRTVCAIPLVQEDEVRGALTLYSGNPGAFPLETHDALAVFARQATLFLVNASLYREAKASIEELLAKERDLKGFIEQIHRSQQALKASEQKYKALVETTGTGYVILDTKGQVLDANPEYVRLAGRESMEDVLGRNVLEWTAADDKARNAAEVLTCLETGSVQNLEIRYCSEEGRETPVEINATLVPHPSGPRIVSLVRDISDRRRQDEAVRRSEAAYRGIVENAAAVVLKFDHECRITYWNDYAETFFGYSREEVLGRSLFDTIVPASESTGRDLKALLLKIADDPNRFAANINENITRDGRRVWMAWSNRPILDERGRVLEVLSLAIDITAIKADGPGTAGGRGWP